MDAIFLTTDNRTYVFSGRKFWSVNKVTETFQTSGFTEPVVQDPQTWSFNRNHRALKEMEVHVFPR